MLQEYTTFLKKVEEYSSVPVKNGSVSKPDFVEMVVGLGASEMAQKSAEKFHEENVRNQKFTPETLKSIFSLFNTRSRDLVSPPVSIDVKLFGDLMEQVSALVAFARDKGVRIMVDAEQTDGVAKLNEPVVFNTYQMYLVDLLDRLKRDVEKAEPEGHSFGIKLVRGGIL
ncbi:hypothetical protein HK098_004126 [Nowakowskiella sp. JEL0407]|nr:hypothetical protein HK098_004126 [Nowakowskiella sp. JEL0407]